MKTPEEILSEKTGYSVSELIERNTEPILQPFDCLEAIKKAQKEAIEETVRRCKAEAYAEESYPECSWEVNMDTFADIETELKKELGL